VKNWIKPGVDGANLEVDDFLSKRITNLGTVLLRVSTRRYLLEYEISFPEWRLLTMLVRCGGSCTTRALRDASKMDKGQMSRALLGLESRKLVQRSQDETHERRHVLEITEKGLQLYRRIMPSARRAQVALLKRLTVDERRTLDTVINKLNAVAEAED
jgi:DNA-binding MarR family transcriptional regulator